MYVADIGNHRIRRVDLATGIVETIAGDSQPVAAHDGQLAKGSSFLGPRALFIHAGVLWIASREGHAVWRLALNDGVLRHIAGTGAKGPASGDGPGREVQFNGPKGIAVGPSGDVFVADTENNAIRQIDFDSGRVAAIAGGRLQSQTADGESEEAGLNGPHGICVGPDGVIYIGDTLNHRVVRILPEKSTP